MSQRDFNENNSEESKSAGQISHLALDIGGSLIKVVYLSRSSGNCNDTLGVPNGEGKSPIFKGKLHFAKFETRNINDCLEFINSKKLHLGGLQHHDDLIKEKNFIKATGGGAYKFADLFKDKLGISLDKEDEMDCLVRGANFVLKTFQREAYTYINGEKEVVQIDHNDLYPYLLVNIGSGVSMIKVDGDGKYERVSGTSVGGGTFWALGRLLTKCKSFDELLELSHKGDNRAVDMLVGDINGGTDYLKIGLSSTTIASSFGKVISDNKELDGCKPEDIARSLLRMISNNIGQISHSTALRFDLKRIFFGGFFIRGHPYTMDTISVAVDFWSKGEAKAMFLNHEGFLGALGAFVSYKEHNIDDLVVNQSTEQLVGADKNGNTANGGKGRVGSKVSLKQLIQPAIVTPPLIPWYLRGLTSRTRRDLTPKSSSGSENCLIPSRYNELEKCKSSNIKERWAQHRRNAKQLHKRLWTAG